MRWNGKRIVRWCLINPNIEKKNFERNSHWRKLSMIMVWEHYCNTSSKPEFFFIFFVYIFIHISANMSLFGLKFSQMILHTETSKLMHNWSFLFVVLHKPTLLPSTFNLWWFRNPLLGPENKRSSVVFFWGAYWFDGVFEPLGYVISLLIEHFSLHVGAMDY